MSDTTNPGGIPVNPVMSTPGAAAPADPQPVMPANDPAPVMPTPTPSADPVVPMPTPTPTMPTPTPTNPLPTTDTGMGGGMPGSGAPMGPTTP